MRSQAESLPGLVLQQPPPGLLPTVETCQHIHSPTLRRSRLCPYSSKMVVPLCITPFPVIIQVPRGSRSGRGHEGEARTPPLYRAVPTLFPEAFSPACLFSDSRFSPEKDKKTTVLTPARALSGATPQPLTQPSQV